MQRLKDSRKSAGLSQADLAKATGIPFRTIQNIEAAEDCKVSQLKKISDALGVLITELID